jgi:hypothetical protein
MTRGDSNDKVILPVSVFGMDAEGKPFHQLTTAQAVSTRGAVLEGVECRLRPGEIIGVQYGHQKARALVVWLCEVEFGPKTQVGVQLVSPAGCPWESQLPKAPEEPSRMPKERRNYPRYRVCMGLELRHSATGMRMQAQTSDMSASGCYVETLLPLPADTCLQIVFWIGADKWEIYGIVRTSHPGVGMGIEFTSIDSIQQKMLGGYLKSLVMPASVARTRSS